MAAEEVSDLRLEEAAETGDLEVLHSVPLERLKAFRHSNGMGWPLLEVAVYGQQAEVVEWLVRQSLASGLDFVWGWTLGHAAAFGGDLEALRQLDADQLHARERGGLTLMHAVAWGGSVEAIELLVELGLDPKATTNKGSTTIYVAALNGHVAAIERLVELGVDPKVARNDGWTAIHSAASNGHVAAIERLVELGVDPNATTKDGQTPLHSAGYYGQPTAAAYLLHLGVDPAARTKYGTTALKRAVEQNNKATASVLRRPRGWLVLAADKPAEFVGVDDLPEMSALLTMLITLGDMNSERLETVLRSSSHLQWLEVLGLRGLDSAGIRLVVSMLADCPKLRNLDLSSSVLGDTNWLQSCTSLTSLSLGGCNLSSANLDVIAALPRLRRLVLAEAMFDSLDSLAAGCPELRFLDVRECGISKAPTFLVLLPKLEELVVADNPFVTELQEYAELLADPAAAVDFLRSLSLSSEGKTRDVPVLMVGHGRAGKSQVLRALLHERSWMGKLLGVLERVPKVEERTCKIESGVHSLQLSATRQVSPGETAKDSFEARFFDTPGQMEFFASNMTVLAPLFSSCAVVCVVRCVPHGALGSRASLPEQKARVAAEFRLWLAEVSRAVVGAHAGARRVRAVDLENESQDAATESIPPNKRASVLLVLTHRDVLKKAHGEEAVFDMEMWLQTLVEELSAEFEDSLVVDGAASLVNATVAGASGHGVLPVREQLESLVYARFVQSPTLPEVLVDARAFVVSEEVRQQRIVERPALEELLSSKFGDRGLTIRLLRRLLEVLETNGSVLRTPARRLVVVDPSWMSLVMSSLYVDPRLHDVEHEMGVDASEFDALAAFDEGGEVLAGELRTHLRQFANGDEALLERLLVVLVSNGIAVPLRVGESASRRRKTESYMIVGRWMANGDGEDSSGVGVGWSTARRTESSWLRLVTGCLWSSEAAGALFGLAPGERFQDTPAFRLVSLRCTSSVRMGPSFLTWLMYELSTKLDTGQHSFTVRRSGFACVLPFTRFQAAVHVQLPASGRAFDVTVVVKAEDAEAALSFVLLEVVFPVLDKLSLQGGVQRLRVVQRCGGCVATHKRLESDPLHDLELESGVEAVGTEESVKTLCAAVCVGPNYRANACCGYDGVLDKVVFGSSDGGGASPHSGTPGDFAASFVPSIDPASLDLAHLSVLASGQFGSVLESSYNGARVVLKKPKVASEAALETFEREAQLLGRACKHPCIAQLLGLCRMSASQVYLVMERAGVCDLEQALCKTPKKPLLGKDWSEFGVLVGLLKDVADGLRHMHSQQPAIVHNDVALRNVLVRYEVVQQNCGHNRAKLTDMGLACGVKRGTVKRLAKGTPMPRWQLAPETLSSRVVSPASDVYQFGNLVFEMVARQRPFWSEWKIPGGKEVCDKAREAVVDGIIAGERPSWDLAKEAGAYCPRWLRELADKCRSSEVKQRPTMVWVSEQLARRIEEMQDVPANQKPLGKYAPSSEGEVQQPVYVSGGGDDKQGDAGESAPSAGQNAASGVGGGGNDDGGDDDEAKEPEADDDDDDPAPVPVPVPAALSLNAWNVDDVCEWLTQLGIPACIELAPLFRHNGIDGELLEELTVQDLTELGVARVPARALLKARDTLTQQS